MPSKGEMRSRTPDLAIGTLSWKFLGHANGQNGTSRESIEALPGAQISSDKRIKLR